MKKQFIAIILTVAMLVAMVPVFAVPASAATVHNIAYAPADIVVDGECDENYTVFNSQSIKSVFNKEAITRNDYVNEALGFEGYALATPEGVYVWMGVYGDSDYENAEGDTPTYQSESLQIFFNMGDSSADTKYINAVFFDYEGNIGFHKGDMSGVSSAAVKKDDGWTGEVFIPWIEGSTAAKAVASGSNDFFFALGVRYNDDYAADSPLVKRANSESEDNKRFNSYTVDDEITNYSSSYSDLPVVEFATYDFEVEEGEEGGVVIDPDMRVAPFIDSDPTIDGSRDYMYAKGTKITNISNHGTSGKKGNGEMFEAYVVTTKSGFYVWAKMMDSTHLNLVKDGPKGDYLQIYYNMSESANNITTNGYVQFDYNNQFKFANYGSTGGNLSASNVKLKTIANEDSWIAEVFVPWRDNSAIKNAIAAGETDFFFALGLQYNDDKDGDANRDDYYYDDSKGGNYWSKYDVLVPYQVIHFDTAPDIPVAEKINFSNVLTVGPNITNPVMRYTVYGSDGSVVKVSDVNGVLTGENKYLFSFDIAPQYMNSKVTAELMYSGVVLSTVAEQLSIRDYCIQLVNMDPDDSGLSANQFLAMKYLIYNMLNYGAAAQNYLGYETDNLVNKGFEDLAFNFEEFDYQDIKKTEAVATYDAELVSMGLHFDSANRMYVKFTADDINNYKVTFSDGKPGLAQTLPVYAVEGEANTYIAYTPTISPENYHYQYTIRLVSTKSQWNNVVVQTAYCNVNAYLANIIENSENPAMVELAKATYLYAAGVRAYLAS